MGLTFALVNEKTAGSPEVNSVVDLEALQVLTHLPSLGEFGMNAFKVNLSTRNNGRGWFRKITQRQHRCTRTSSLRLYLHHQVHVAFVIITGHGRVRTDDQLPVDLCGQIDVLP